MRLSSHTLFLLDSKNLSQQAFHKFEELTRLVYMQSVIVPLFHHIELLKSFLLCFDLTRPTIYELKKSWTVSVLSSGGVDEAAS